MAVYRVFVDGSSDQGGGRGSHLSPVAVYRVFVGQASCTPSSPRTSSLFIVGNKVFIRTFGCQMNEHDSERLTGLLESDGYETTPLLEEADVVVLNTCCIRENADNKLYGALGQLKSLKKHKPDLKIAVGGCLAQKDGDRLRERADHVDVVFGTHNLHRLSVLLDRANLHGPVTEIWAGPDGKAIPALSLPKRSKKTHSAWITIQRGCNNSCSFCIVPQVRGREISRPFEEILQEVADRAAAGVVEVTLLGQNVNSYGRDLTGRKPLFAELLKAIGEIEEIKRVRFTSPHPKDLRLETIDAIAETANVCEQLHLPLQSGSNRILAAMRRGYTAERYLERLDIARRRIDDLAVTTDIIVGFPGETEGDFEDTLAVVAEAGYDSAYTFIFSPRPGTRAAEMQDRFIPPDVVADRFNRLLAVTERSALEKNRSRIGRIEEVLVDGPDKKLRVQHEGLYSLGSVGRTRQGKLVHLMSSVPGTTVAAGAFATVRNIDAGPHHLQGEILSVAGKGERSLIKSTYPVPDER